MPRKITLVFFAMLAATALHGQQDKQDLDPLTKWATITFNESHVSFNVSYGKANNVDLRLDVITTGPAAEHRPTLIYFHGGGWLEGTKESTLLYGLPYMTRGMNFVNVDTRMAPEFWHRAAVEDCRCALHWVYDHANDYGSILRDLSSPDILRAATSL